MFERTLTIPAVFSHNPVLLTFLSSSSLVGHKASTFCLYYTLSLAILCASPHDIPISFSSLVMVRLQVFLGRPCFLLPSGVHLRAIFGVLFTFILRVCPSHLSLLCFISSTMSWDFDLLNSSVFETFIGQKMRQILQKHPLWNTLICFMSFCVVLQHSDPYSSTGLTTLLYGLMLVPVLYCVDFQMLFSLANAPLALPSLACIKLIKMYVFLGCIVFTDNTNQVSKVINLFKWLAVNKDLRVGC